MNTVITPCLRSMCPARAVAHCIHITKEEWTKVEMFEFDASKYLWQAIRTYILNSYTDPGLIPEKYQDAWMRCKAIIDKEVRI